jgi:hypothetical protein
VAEDIRGIKDAGPWIEKANPDYTVLVDEKHTVATLYGMVNVPTGVWIDENGKMVRPNEVAFIDNRYKGMHGIDAQPYLTALLDWLDKGDKSIYAMTADRLREHLNQFTPQNLLADANFKMGQYLVSAGHAREAIDYFKTAQSLRPDDWNYKRNAWLFANPDKDYGTNFGKEVKALNGKPYYPAPDLPKAPSSLPKGPSSSPRPPE